jgi:hypothetical protein
MSKYLKIVAIFIFTFLTVSCAPFTRSEQSAQSDFIELKNGNNLGQSFVARYDGIQGISIYLKPSPEVQGELTLDLFNKIGNSKPIRSSIIPLTQVSSSGFYNFGFSPIGESTKEDYFYQLTLNGAGEISVGSASGNSYLSGAQYFNGLALNSQSTFSLDYAPRLVLLGLIKEGLGWLGFLIAGLFLLAIPGWAALTWSLPPWKSINWISKLGLALGIGLSTYPILFLWTDTIGIQLGAISAIILPLFGLILIILRFFLDIQARSLADKDLSPETDEFTSGEKSQSRTSWDSIFPDLVFLVVLALIIFTRMWPIRSLDAPMWGDSYQHTMIAQLLVDNGGLFTSWQPYAELASFTYHFGFHSFVTVFHWLTKMSTIQSTLWAGQLVNIFAIVALYPLAVTIGKNKWAGVIAIIIAGLISPMPMYYVNWGRYTQLAGQVILPAIIVIIWLNLDSKEVKTRWYDLIWFGLAGLFLTHYRVILFIPLFYVAYFLIRFRDIGAINLIKRILIHMLGVIALTLPWIFRIFEGTLPDIFQSQITTSPSASSQVVNSIGNITDYLPIYIWILVFLSVIWGIWQRDKKSNIFSLWWIMILLAANPNWIRLPGSGVITNFAVFIAAYIPASVIIASGVTGVLSKVNIIQNIEVIETPGIGFRNDKQKYLVWSGLITIVLILISVWHIIPRIRSIKPIQHTLLTKPDISAGHWINENLPSNSKFLVNSFFAYGGTAVVGSDGGWWLPLLTKRLTTQPPLPYVSESAPHSNFVPYTNELVASIELFGINHPDILEELHNRGITHIYIGQQHGSVNGSPLLNIKDLQDNPKFKLVYNQDRVFIFQVNY